MSWTIEPLDRFAARSGGWDSLNQAGANSPLLRTSFMAPLIRNYATGSELIAVYGTPAQPVAMGIFQRRSRFGWQTFQPPVAPLGAWVMAPGQIIASLLDGLGQALPGNNLLISLSQLDPDFIPRPHDGGRLSSLDYILTPRLTIASTYDSYWQSRSKNLRHTVKRVQNRLQREGRESRLEILEAPGEMAAAVADYGHLELSGWKGAAGTAVGGDESQGKFFTEMMESFCRTGEGLIYRYWFGDKLVASDMCIHDGQTLIILKTAYDESERAFSPAQAMRHAAFRYFFDDRKFRTIEFYGPQKDWHTKLTSETRRMYHVNRYRWPLLAWLHQRRMHKRGAAPAGPGGSVEATVV